MKYFSKILAIASVGARVAAAQTGVGVELRGHFDNALTDPIIVTWQAQPLVPQETKRQVGIDADGNFRLLLPVHQPTAATLTCGEEEMTLFLEPGDQLDIKGDAMELATSVRFQAIGPASQPAAAANNYLQETARRFTDNAHYQLLPENIKLLPQDFIAFLDYRLRHEQSLLRKEDKAGHFSPNFQAYAAAELRYAYAEDRLTYFDLREQAIGNPPGFALPPTYYAFLNEPTLLRDIAVSSPRALDFLLEYVHHQARSAGHQPADPAYFPACYQLADQLVLTQGPREALLGRVVRETMLRGHILHARQMLDHYAATPAPAHWVAALRAEFATRQEMAIGSLPQPLALVQPDSTPFNLSALKGKLVYLLFWDSQRPASQRLLPGAKELANRLRGQPVEILMVALDESKDGWLKRATPVAGITHVWVPAEQQAAARQAYQISRLPAAIILAEDGTLLNAHARDVNSRSLQDELPALIGKSAAYKALALPGHFAQEAPRATK